MTTSTATGSRRVDFALALLLELLEQTPVGGKLKPERELALQFGVSRRVIREALAHLEMQGRVARTPGLGTIVLDLTTPDLALESPSTISSFSDFTTSQTSDAALLGSSPLELMDARLVLEPALAAAAAMRASSQDIQKMLEYVELGRQAKSPQEWERWDSAFHQLIGDATRNQLLQYFYQVLSAARAQTEWGRLRQQSLNSKNQHYYSEQHAAILTAIQARDPRQAAENMRAHLHTVKHTLIDGLAL